MTATDIEIWSDIGCPWATLALDTLRRAASDTGRDLAIRHRSFPLELFNERPTPRDILDAEIVTIAGLLPHLGWRPWHADPATYAVSTLPAMAAVHGLAARAGTASADSLDAALRTALYRDSRCISVPAEILRAGREAPGVDPALLEDVLRAGDGMGQVWADFDEAREAERVQGSPHLFAGSRDWHNPGADYGWTAPPPAGLPRLHAYDSSWALQVLAAADAAADPQE